MRENERFIDPTDQLQQEPEGTTQGMAIPGQDGVYYVKTEFVPYDQNPDLRGQQVYTPKMYTRKALKMMLVSRSMMILSLSIFTFLLFMEEYRNNTVMHFEICCMTWPILFLIGAIAFITLFSGRREFGDKHERFVQFSLYCYGLIPALGFVVPFIAEAGSSGNENFIVHFYFCSFLILWEVSRFFQTIQLQNMRGRVLQITSLLLLIPLVFAIIGLDKFGEEVLYAAPGQNHMISFIFSPMMFYSYAVVVNTVAVWLAYKRIETGEIKPSPMWWLPAQSGKGGSPTPAAVPLMPFNAQFNKSESPGVQPGSLTQIQYPVYRPRTQDPQQQMHPPNPPMVQQQQTTATQQQPPPHEPPMAVPVIPGYPVYSPDPSYPTWKQEHGAPPPTGVPSDGYSRPPGERTREEPAMDQEHLQDMGPKAGITGEIERGTEGEIEVGFVDGPDEGEVIEVDEGIIDGSEEEAVGEVEEVEEVEEGIVDGPDLGSVGEIEVGTVRGEDKGTIDDVDDGTDEETALK